MIMSEIHDQAGFHGDVTSQHMQRYHPDGKPDPDNCKICDFYNLGRPQPEMKLRCAWLDFSENS